uniref:RNase III domain-containing protein n=1 Tax=viral metagenome TaxID=1070528 RepID=A0A6C0KTY9_9ZZZZ
MQDLGPITHGCRGKEFKQFIFNLLRKGNIKQKYVNLLLDDEAMDLYSKAFTNPTADVNCNYEILEKIGDSTCNKAIIWYIYRKFPKLESKPQGLMIFSRLFHTLQSTETFSKLGLSLGFEKFISYGYMRVKDRYEDVMKVKRNGVLEDCFEAFFGATELLIDRKTKEGVGYAICNEIFKGIIEDLPFPSIKYEDLFDPITRLKELFDYNFPGKGRLGKYEYISEEMQDEDNKLKTVNIVWINIAGAKMPIAKGTGSLKEKAKAVAAENALHFFKSRGYEKTAPYDYREFL